MRFIGVDPGSSNFGYSVVERGRRIAILEFGQIEDTVKNLTDKPQKPPKSRRKKEGPIPPLEEAMALFLSVFEHLLDQYKPDEVIAERFQPRGIKGKSTELVSFMLGIMALCCKRRNIRFRVTIAGTWKNKVNRNYSIDLAYDFGKMLGISPHEIDAILIGLTRAGKLNPPPLAKLKRLLQLIVKKQDQS